MREQLLFDIWNPGHFTAPLFSQFSVTRHYYPPIFLTPLTVPLLYFWHPWQFPIVLLKGWTIPLSYFHQGEHGYPLQRKKEFKAWFSYPFCIEQNYYLLCNSNHKRTFVVTLSQVFGFDIKLEPSLNVTYTPTIPSCPKNRGNIILHTHLHLLVILHTKIQIDSHRDVEVVCIRRSCYGEP